MSSWSARLEHVNGAGLARSAHVGAPRDACEVGDTASQRSIDRNNGEVLTCDVEEVPANCGQSLSACSETVSARSGKTVSTSGDQTASARGRAMVFASGDETVSTGGDETASPHRDETTPHRRIVSNERASLEQLRDHIARILAKSPVSRTPTSPTEPRELGFLPEPTDAGPVYVRRTRLPVTHRVGRVRTEQARVASMQMLALLALDPSIAWLDPCRALYFDTETSGLAGGAGTVAFLIGVGFFDPDDGGFVVEQMLLTELGTEAPMLSRLSLLMSRASMLVSYNGKAFDLPLLQTRFVLNRIAAPALVAHLDLVHIARRVHRHRLAQRTLAQIESQVLGFGRIDDVPSAEIPSRYFHFLRTRDEGPLVAVVDHNLFDVTSMVALVGVYGESLEALAPIDLIGVARTLGRAKSPELARDVIDRAIDRGAGSEAVRVRAELARARGDKALALADFASLLDTVDDPKIRLELAKLYEHYARQPLAALDVVARGTGEDRAAETKRRDRLMRKATMGPPATRRRRF